MLTVKLDHRLTKFASILPYFLLVITLAYLLGQYLRFDYNLDTAKGFIPLFDMDGEGNIPAWFSASLFLLCALLLQFIALYQKSQHAPYVKHWQGLFWIFIFLSMDEASQIHEKTIKPLRNLLHVHEGVLYFAWVIPGAIFVMIMIYFYYKFIMSLPAQTKLHFLVSAGLYILGALGIELIQGYYASQYGFNNIRFVILVTLEEVLEISGIIVFFYGLSQYIESKGPYITFNS